MPGSRKPSDGEHFTEAIAHWQLDVQTELKRASSLPTAMFDACDPMLEARLAEATESLFRCLLELDRRELAALLRDAAQGRFDDTEGPALDENDEGEFYAILAETCSRGPEAGHERAAALLGGFDAGDLHDLDRLAAAIERRVAADAPAGDDEARALAAECRRVAAAVARHAGRAGRQA
jgi:hypothetical protein